MSLSGPANLWWASTYQQARDMYTSIDGYYDEDAALTADAALAGWWSSRGGWHRKPSLPGLPNPPIRKEVFTLGCFIGLHVINRDGSIDVFRASLSDRIPLLWCQATKACLIFPYMKPSECIFPPTPQGNRLSKIWRKGRSAECSSIEKLPNIALPNALPAIAVEYASDKFNTTGELEFYIHHHEKGVVAYFSNPNPFPRAIALQGGRLRVTPDGLEG